MSGGFHCRVTVVEVTEAFLSEHGSLGTKNNIMFDFSTVVSSYVSISHIENIKLQQPCDKVASLTRLYQPYDIAKPCYKVAAILYLGKKLIHKKT